MITRRRRDAPDPYLVAKIALFFAAAAVMAVAVIFRVRHLPLVAIALLLAAMVLRAVDAARQRRARPQWDGDVPAPADDLGDAEDLEERRDGPV